MKKKQKDSMVALRVVNELIQFIHQITRPLFTVGAVGAIPQWLRTCVQQGIIAESDSAGWRKFSFVELIWLRLVIAARKLNVSWEILSKARWEIIEPLKHEEIIEAGRRSKLLHVFDWGDEDFVQAINNVIPQSHPGPNISRLIIWLLDSILSKQPLSILIDEDGKAYIDRPEESSGKLSSDLEAITLTMKNGVRLSITQLIVEFILMDDVENVSQLIALLTPTEAKLLSSIRENQVRQLSVKQQGSTKRTATVIDDDFTEEVFLKYMFTYGYEHLTLELENGERKSCDNDRLQRISSINFSSLKTPAMAGALMTLAALNEFKTENK